MNLAALLVAALILAVFVPLMGLGLSLIPMALGLAIRAANREDAAARDGDASP